MNGRTIFPLALGLAAAIALSGCTPGLFSEDVESYEDADPDSAESAQVTTAHVESRDIVDALSLQATAVAGHRYTVSASEPGMLRAEGNDLFFAPTDDTAYRLDLPETAQSVEELVPRGVVVQANTPLVAITDSAILLAAELTPAQVMRLGQRVPLSSRAQIEGSTGPFDCDLADSRPTVSEGMQSLTCRVPPDVPVVAGAPAQIVLVLERREGVMALPVEAVGGSLERGLVYPADVPDEPRPVELGITDGSYIEILDGLALGEEVLIPSPSLFESDPA